MIKVGHSLILEPLDEEKNDKYRTKLVERKGDKLNIDYPINLKLNRTAFLLTGMQMKATFIDSDNSLYLFDTEVVGREKIGNIDTIIISYPGKESLIKIQRREFVRVETPVDVAVHSPDQEFKAFTSVTEDISAGGAAIVLSKNSKLKEDQRIQATFVIPLNSGEYHYIEIESKIVRIIDLKDGRKIASIKFEDLARNIEQIFIRFSFERQLAMRDKRPN